MKKKKAKKLRGKKSQQAYRKILLKKPLEFKLHARPAAQLAEIASRFSSRVTLSTNSRAADAKSTMSMLSLSANGARTLKVSAEGSDCVQAVKAIKKFLEEKLSSSK